MKVGRIEITTSVTPAKYLLQIIEKSDIGRVKRSSIVPVRFSSAKDLMVIAGIRIQKINGAIPKNVFKSAVPPSITFEAPEKTHKNKLLVMRKIVINM